VIINPKPANLARARVCVCVCVCVCTGTSLWGTSRSVRGTDPGGKGESPGGDQVGRECRRGPAVVPSDPHVCGVEVDVNGGKTSATRHG